MVSHVALLTSSVAAAAKKLEGHGYDIGPVDTFEKEGTREIYVNYANAASLLLVEAAGPGPYQRALEKRGPGLHHFGIDVPTLTPFLLRAEKAGWRQHSTSAVTILRSGTAWLYAPGFPGLLEVQEREEEEMKKAPPFITKVELPLANDADELLKAVDLAGLVIPGEPVLWIGETRLPLPLR